MVKSIKVRKYDFYFQKKTKKKATENDSPKNLPGVFD